MVPSQNILSYRGIHEAPQKKIDPEVSAMQRARTLRRRKYISSGPNAVWYADVDDGLNPYSFPIHGTIF